MASDQGIDFRATSGYVTDPANCTYCLGDTYPTVRATWTFGWSAAPAQTRDRDSTVANKSLAGMNLDNNTAHYFQLDLPGTGSTDIHAAFGDATSDGQDTNFIIKDTTTNIVTIAKSNITHLHYMDATNVERNSVALWTSNEAATTYSMASTALRAYINSSTSNVIAFLRAVQAGGGGTSGVISSAGAATAVFKASAGAATTLSSAGAATAVFTASSAASTTLSGAGASTATFTGSSRATGDLSSAGAATAFFVGASAQAGATDLSASGAATANFTSASAVASTLSASGAATVKFVGSSRGGGSAITTWGKVPAKRRTLKDENEEVLEMVKMLAPLDMARIRNLH